MANEVGVAYVRLLPSMRGFSGEVASALKGAVTKPSQDAGDDAGAGFSSGFRSSSGRGMDGAGSSAGGKFTSALKGALAAGAVAAGALLAAGIAEGLDTEVATDKLEAQLGGGEWAEGAGQVAADLYGDAFGENITETADAVKAVWQGGLFPDDASNAQLEAMTARAMTFADVLDQDLQMSVNAASQMLRTGLAGSATEAFDIMTAGVQRGADKAGDLAETFNEYGTMFRDVGLSGADAMGLISQGLNAGARDADKVADALKEFAIRAQDGSTMSAEGFRLLGMDATAATNAVAAGGESARAALGEVLNGLAAMTDPAERNAAAVALFGTQAEDLGDALYSLDLDTAASGLGDYAGATDELGSAYDNAGTRIEAFKRQALQGIANVVANDVLPKLEAFTAWARENPGLMQAVAAVIGGALVLAFAAWAVSAASAAVATIAATWPILAIGAAAALLAALIVTHWDTIRNAIVGAWNWVTSATSAAWNWITNAVKTALGWLWSAFTTWTLPGLIIRHWNSIKEGAANAWRAVKTTVNGVISWFTGIPGRLAAAAGGMWNFITSGFKSAVNTVIRWWNNLSFTLPSIHIPGFDPPGPGPSFGGATIGGQTFSTPNIPLLGDGGIATSATLAVIGEDGGEAIIPLDRLAELLGGHGLDTRAPAAAAAGGPVVLDLRGLPRAMVEHIRHIVRTQGRGDVQLALGTSAA